MCTSPREASYHKDGSINFSRKNYNKELAPFQVPCGQCIECKLERARDWAIRCTHESKMHEKNSFITLTYSPEKLPEDEKLRHLDFQLFMKKIRKEFGNDIGFFMCGEYGDQTQRPHYHACLFGVDFDDKKIERENDHGDTIWSSKKLTELWGHGHTELGSVTPQSAGYVARYIIKKQKDSPLQPYQKMSRKHAIGKRFVEKWYHDIFIAAKGAIILSDGSRSKVPRYYEKWLKKYQPELWVKYITETKHENTQRLKEKAETEHKIFLEEKNNTSNPAYYQTPLARKREILKTKLKQLKRRFL